MRFFFLCFILIFFALVGIGEPYGKIEPEFFQFLSKNYYYEE
jgi:hypothetical protein